MTVKSHYRATDLVGLPGMPSTKRGVNLRAEKEAWPKSRASGLGGSYWEYPLTCLPAETQAALIDSALTKSNPVEAIPAGVVAPSVAGSLPVAATRAPVAPSSFVKAGALVTAPPRLALAKPMRLNAVAAAGQLTEAQRSNGAARLAFLQTVYALRPAFSLEAACKAVARNAERGALAADLQALLPVANARGGTLSARTLMRWHSYLQTASPTDPGAQIAALAEIVPVKSLDLPPDVIGAIAQLDTSGNSLMAACRAYARQNGWIDDHAAVARLYHRAARALRDKVPESTMHKRRHSGAGLTAKRPHVTRSRENLLPNDIWVIDGHSMKAKWAHPETGKPFVPEFTKVMDWATGRVVGWSFSLSENALAVREAILNGIRDHGKPGMVYSDGGAGETAAEIDDPIRGLYATFHIEHHIGRPGNPQGRGVIERSWAADAIEVARANPLFRGAGVDRDTLRRRSVELDKALRKAKADPTNVVPISMLPPLIDCIESTRAAIAEYNNRPHRGLPKNPATGLHHSPNSYAETLLALPECVIERVPIEAQRLMFMPYLIRPATCFEGAVVIVVVGTGRPPYPAFCLASPMQQSFSTKSRRVGTPCPPARGELNGGIALATVACGLIGMTCLKGRERHCGGGRGVPRSCLPFALRRLATPEIAWGANRSETYIQKSSSPVLLAGGISKKRCNW